MVASPCSPAARAARARPGTALTSILQPFNRLLVSWSGNGEAGQLTGAEFDGAVSALPPDRLVSGFYLNELLLKLFARHDSHPDVFSLYAPRWTRSRSTPTACARCGCSRSDCWTRSATGSHWSAMSVSDEPLDARHVYHYRLDQGAMRIDGVAEGADIFSGSTLLALAREDFADPAVCAEARALLRAALDRCLEGKELRTRQVMLALRRRRSASISSMLHLGVNVDHVATLRQARRASYPDPVFAALIAEQAGADNITMHLREDRRHIQDRDIRAAPRRAADAAELRDGGDRRNGRASPARCGRQTAAWCPSAAPR